MENTTVAKTVVPPTDTTMDKTKDTPKDTPKAVPDERSTGPAVIPTGVVRDAKNVGPGTGQGAVVVDSTKPIVADPSTAARAVGHEIGAVIPTTTEPIRTNTPEHVIHAPDPNLAKVKPATPAPPVAVDVATPRV
jgi:hypothetical protein